MKLYFYFLKQNGIESAECEVEEKPKTYRPIDKFPREYYGCYVNKSDIGVMKNTYYTKTIIFTEPSFEKAKDIFSSHLNGIIETMKKNLSEYEEQLKAVETSTNAD